MDNAEKDSMFFENEFFIQEIVELAYGKTDIAEFGQEVLYKLLKYDLIDIQKVIALQ